MHHFRIDYSASLGKLPVLLCPSHMQGSNMLLYNLSIQLFDYLFICIIFAQTMEQGKYPYSYVFFNMQGSNMLLCNLSIHFFFFTFMYHFRIDQGKYPYSYVFFKMQGSNMLLCNLSIHFFSLLCIISHRPWSRVSVRTFMSFSICKEVICFYAISLSNFFHFYVSFSHRP